MKNRVLNKQMFQLIVKNDTNSVGLPPQVELQPPVILLDAFGLRAPFHLDSITSADVSYPLLPSGDVYCSMFQEEDLLPQSLFNFLAHRFQSAGAEKIENGEFILEENKTSRRIDLEQPWDTCFVPGETIRMTFIFFGRKHVQSHQTRLNKGW